MRFTVLSPIATSMSAQMIFQFGFSDASAAAATAVTASRMRQSKVEIVRMMVTMKSSTLTCPQRVCSGVTPGLNRTRLLLVMPPHHPFIFDEVAHKRLRLDPEAARQLA